MKKIFEQTKIGSMTMKNRIIRSAIGDHGTTEDGHYGQSDFDGYEKVAMGGVGTLITGYSWVSDYPMDGRGKMLGAYSDDFIPEYRQLTDMVHSHNCNSGIRILITADHGFLYTYSPLKEDSKVGKDSFTNRILEYGRRFAILSQGDKPDYLMPIMLCERPAKFDGYAPMENIRIKMNGGGMNFVHGGASLQEMVVPVIDYRHYRNDNKQYQKRRDQLDTKPVSLALLSASRKITNMIFSLNFYQQEAVSGNREAATYQVYFTDVNGKKISDVQKIIADKANADVQERTFRCNFSLKSQQYKNTDTYYLVIADETGLQQPIKEEFQIDIAFATDDFNFFS